MVLGCRKLACLVLPVFPFLLPLFMSFMYFFLIWSACPRRTRTSLLWVTSSGAAVSIYLFNLIQRSVIQSGDACFHCVSNLNSGGYVEWWFNMKMKFFCLKYHALCILPLFIKDDHYSDKGNTLTNSKKPAHLSIRDWRKGQGPFPNLGLASTVSKQILTDNEKNMY